MSARITKEIVKTIALFVIPTASMVFLIVFSSFLYEKLTVVEEKLAELKDQSNDWNKTTGKMESEMQNLRDDLKSARDEHLSDSDRMTSGLMRIQDIYFDLLNKNDGMDFVYKDPNTGKIAYLTFDDGPSANTQEVLNILARENIKASFFVNGHQNFSNMYKKITDAGHVLGNHGFSHVYTDIYQGVENFVTDQEKLELFVSKVGGKLSKIYRFPGGAKNTFAIKIQGPDLTAKISQAMAERGYHFFEWNVTGDDTEIKADNTAPTSADIAAQVLALSKTKRIALILLHDGAGHIASVKALPAIIEGLRKQGFSFRTLPLK